ncbi:hypothetical protein QBC44DRAFT_333870 [Cladorrhinum sp. PSN332]|nr:hypothetical protein QBC44DRAFT_333870 [Cladorrhinum sp. PSN332]
MDNLKVTKAFCTSTSDLGLVLASALETLIQLTPGSKRYAEDILVEINGTASGLCELWKLVAADSIAAKEQGRPHAFTQAGLDEIRLLDVNCEKLYRTIISFTQKAARKGFKTYQPPTVFDPASVLGPLTSLHTIDWDWLGPRVERCQEQLRWLKIMLLVDIQAGHLASLQLNTSKSRPTGSFDRELGLRVATEKLWNRQLTATREQAEPMDLKAKSQSVHTTSTPSHHVGTESDSKSPSSALTLLNGPGPQTLPQSPEIKMEKEGSICTTVVGDLDKSEFPSPPYPPKVEPKTVGLMGQENLDKLGPSDQSKDAAMSGKLEANTNDEKGKTPDICPNNETTKAEDKPQPVNKANELALLSSGPFSSRMPGFLGRWLNAIRGKRNDDRLNEVQSQELEAWVIHDGTTGTPIKVPFGHQRLKQGLNRLLRNSKTEPWNCYMNLTPQQREIIDHVTKFANCPGSQIRTCVAFDEIKKDGQAASYVVFFSLTPGRCSLHFKDAIGRKFAFPFELVKTWNGMNDMIKQAFLNMDVIGPHVEAGHFDLINEAGVIILPRCWTASVNPGSKITMHMWPMDKYPIPGVPRRPTGWPSAGAAMPRWPSGPSGGGLPMHPQARRPYFPRPAIGPRTGTAMPNTGPPKAFPNMFSPHPLGPIRPGQPVIPPASPPMPKMKIWKDKNAIKPEEESQLDIIDFGAMWEANKEANKAEGGAFSQFLAKMTNMTDVASNREMLEELCVLDISDISDDSDSDADSFL